MHEPTINEILQHMTCVDGSDRLRFAETRPSEEHTLLREGKNRRRQELGLLWELDHNRSVGQPGLLDGHIQLLDQV